MEQALRGSIEFPWMRSQIIDTVRSLSDPMHQCTKWGRYDPIEHYYDDLDINIHILYDDTTVVPNPELSISSLLYESEVPALRALDTVLGPLIDDLGDAPDEIYLADPRWPSVIHAAANALAAMEANETSDEATH